MRFISETAESWLMVGLELELLMLAVSAWFTFSLTSPIADVFHEIERRWCEHLRWELRTTSVFGLNKLVTPRRFETLSIERVFKLEALSWQQLPTWSIRIVSALCPSWTLQRRNLDRTHSEIVKMFSLILLYLLIWLFDSLVYRTLTNKSDP